MVRRSGQRRAAAPRPGGAKLRNSGIVARLVKRAAHNPALTGGVMAIFLTVGAIVSNAVFLQHARHPDPLFSTRPPVVSEETTPIPSPAPDRTGEVPLPRSRVAASAAVRQPAPVPPSAAEAPIDAGLIAELQRRLAERGFYDGKVDGIPGARTRAAIVAYENAKGLPVSGIPSRDLLGHIKVEAGQGRLEQAAPVAAVPDKNAPPAAASAAANAAATNPSDTPGAEPETAAPVAPPAAPVAAADSEPTADATPQTDAPAGTSRYRAVQHALNQIGSGPISELGVADAATADAIRRFELDNGLRVTGEPGDAVVDRLVAIGALEAI